MSNAVYPGNGYNSDRGFAGVLDGNGYIIDGLALKSNGLFGQMIHAVVKNVAFTNASLSGNYKTVFAHNINRGKNPDNTFNPIECTLENVYISIASIATGTGRIGVLANNQTYTGAKFSNIVVEYLNYEDHVKANVDAGKAVYLLGSMNKDNGATAAACNANEFANVYVISKAPALAHKFVPGIAINQIELIEEEGKITGVGAILDQDIKAYLDSFGLTADVKNLLYGVKAYDDYSQMANDAEANAESLATFGEYWVVKNGVAYWKEVYKNNFTVQAKQGDNTIEGEIVLKDASTAITLNKTPNRP